MKAPVLDHDGHGVRRLEDPADTDATRQMHVGADLGAAAHRRPRVDHRARTDPGADVDELGMRMTRD